MNPLPVALALASITVAALTGPAACGEPVHVAAPPATSVSARPAGLQPIDPTSRADCATATAVGPATRVGVVRPDSTDFVDAGSAQWYVSARGTCAGYTWVVLDLDAPTVYFSQVQTRYGGRIEVALASPSIQAAPVLYTATVHAGGPARLVSTAIRRGTLPTWAQSQLYPLEFLGAQMYFSG